MNVATGGSDCVSPGGRSCCVPSWKPLRRPDIRQHASSIKADRQSSARALRRPVGLPPVESQRNGTHRWPINFYGYRWYDPLTGRWMSKDPIGERGGLNLYGFVRNASINHIDLLGLDVLPFTNDGITPSQDINLKWHAPPGAGDRWSPWRSQDRAEFSYGSRKVGGWWFGVVGSALGGKLSTRFLRENGPVTARRSEGFLWATFRRLFSSCQAALASLDLGMGSGSGSPAGGR